MLSAGRQPRWPASRHGGAVAGRDADLAAPVAVNRAGRHLLVPSGKDLWLLLPKVTMELSGHTNNGYVLSLNAFLDIARLDFPSTHDKPPQYKALHAAA